MTKKTPEETRARLIQAAIDIIVDRGAAYLTLDMVAQEAQVSKGGLLHHFPTKKALMHGIDERAMQMWDQRLALELSQEPEGQPGRWSRAYIRASFDRSPEEIRVLLALTRIVGVYPGLIERWRQASSQACANLVEDGLPEGRAVSIQVACDGLWLGEVIGLPLIPDDQRALLRADLMRLSFVI